MAKALKITGCKDCPFFKEEPIFTEDSFSDSGDMFCNYICTKAKKKTHRKPAPVMEFCPLPEFDELKSKKQITSKRTRLFKDLKTVRDRRTKAKTPESHSSYWGREKELMGNIDMLNWVLKTN